MAAAVAVWAPVAAAVSRPPAAPATARRLSATDRPTPAVLASAPLRETNRRRRRSSTSTAAKRTSSTSTEARITSSTSTAVKRTSVRVLQPVAPRIERGEREPGSDCRYGTSTTRMVLILVAKSPPECPERVVTDPRRQRSRCRKRRRKRRRNANEKRRLDTDRYHAERASKNATSVLQTFHKTNSMGAAVPSLLTLGCMDAAPATADPTAVTPETLVRLRRRRRPPRPCRSPRPFASAAGRVTEACRCGVRPLRSHPPSSASPRLPLRRIATAAGGTRAMEGPLRIGRATRRWRRPLLPPRLQCPNSQTKRRKPRMQRTKGHRRRKRVVTTNRRKCTSPW